jgi:hypothetical protein
MTTTTKMMYNFSVCKGTLVSFITIRFQSIFTLSSELTRNTEFSYT